MGQDFFSPAPPPALVSLAKSVDLFGSVRRELSLASPVPLAEVVWLLELASAPQYRAQAVQALLDFHQPTGSVVEFIAKAVQRCSTSLGEVASCTPAVASSSPLSSEEQVVVNLLLPRVLPFVFRPPVTSKRLGLFRHPWHGEVSPLSVRALDVSVDLIALSGMGFEVVPSVQPLSDPYLQPWASGIIAGFASAPRGRPPPGALAGPRLSDLVLQWAHALAVQQPWWGVIIVGGGFLKAHDGKAWQLVLRTAKAAGFDLIPVVSGRDRCFHWVPRHANIDPTEQTPACQGFCIPLSRRCVSLVAIRQDVAAAWGTPLFVQSPNCVPDPIQSWLDPPELHWQDWVPASWWDACRPFSEWLQDGSDKPLLVARLVKGPNAGAPVFTNRIPAFHKCGLRSSEASSAVRPIFVAQQGVEAPFAGQWIVRPVLPAELEERVSLVFASGASWNPAASPASAAFPALVLDGIQRFFRPPSAFVPTSVSQIISADAVSVYRGTMHLHGRDFLNLKRLGLTNLDPSAVHDGPPVKRIAPTGGVVFLDPVPEPAARGTSWFLPLAWQTGDVGDVVPSASVQSPSPSHMNPAWFGALGASYPDQEFIHYIMSGGINPYVPLRDATPSMIASNHNSALHHFPFVDKAVNEEVCAGRMFAFTVDQSPTFWPGVATPKGAVRKPHRSGGFDPKKMRPTADRSWPAPAYWLELLLKSPNASVDLERDAPYIFYITGVDIVDEILWLEALGEEVYFAMFDLMGYYRQFGTDPNTWWTQLSTWATESGVHTLVDTCMMFGDAAAANHAMRCSGFVAWLVFHVVKNLEPTSTKVQEAFGLLRRAMAHGCHPVAGEDAFVYAFINFFIDDFVLLAALPAAGIDGRPRGAALTMAFSSVLELLGLIPQGEKVLPDGGFVQKGKILGTYFDCSSSPKTASVPTDKVAKTVKVIDAALALKWLPVTDVQVLLGLIAYCSKILVCSKHHLCHTVVALKIGCRKGFAPLHSMLIEELGFWRSLLEGWNCTSILAPRVWLSFNDHPFEVPWTDASRKFSSLSGGAGAMLGHFFMHFEFTEFEIQHLPIMQLEGMVVVLWLEQLSELDLPELLQGKRFVMRCDNDPFCKAVNAKRSNEPDIAFLLARLHLLQARFSFTLELVWVASKENVASDALSRLDFETFYAHMMSMYGLHRSQLVKVQVDSAKRSSLASSLIARRSSKTLSLQPR